MRALKLKFQPYKCIKAHSLLAKNLQPITLESPRMLQLLQRLEDTWDTWLINCSLISRPSYLVPRSPSHPNIRNADHSAQDRMLYMIHPDSDIASDGTVTVLVTVPRPA